MMKLIYQKFYREQTISSREADDYLTKKIQTFLKDKDLFQMDASKIEEVIYAAALIGHEAGFFCAIDIVQRLFTEIWGRGKDND